MHTLSSAALSPLISNFISPSPLYIYFSPLSQVSIVANYIKERTKDAQFIIISLRNNMFELADRLVGIYKTRDVTKSVTINPKLIAANCAVSTAAGGTSSSAAAAAAAATGSGAVGL